MIFTNLQSCFACTTEHFYIRIDPRDHVAGHVSGAVGQAHDVHGPQHSVPHVELAQLAHKGLGGIEAASNDVLHREAEDLIS